jgi:hypothetical protein
LVSCARLSNPMTLDALEALDASGQIAMLTPERRVAFLAWCAMMGVPIEDTTLPALLETWLTWERPITDPSQDA